MPPRIYAPIWNKIKSTGTAQISANPAYHRRIKKAMRKEKDEDLGYKLEQLEMKSPRRAVVTSRSSGSVITFKLHFELVISVDTV